MDHKAMHEQNTKQDSAMHQGKADKAMSDHHAKQAADCKNGKNKPR